MAALNPIPETRTATVEIYSTSATDPKQTPESQSAVVAILGELTNKEGPLSGPFNDLDVIKCYSLTRYFLSATPAWSSESCTAGTFASGLSNPKSWIMPLYRMLVTETPASLSLRA